MPSHTFSFFQHSLKKITSCSYKSAKVAHDMRLGYALLGRSVRHLGKDIPSLQSASHLSYILPNISFLCSLVDSDIALDKGAFLWALVNGLQCYVPELSHSKSLTLSAYGLDVYLGYLNDKNYSKRNQITRCANYLQNASETVYAVLVLGTICACLFDQTDMGLLFFEMSLFLKIVLLTREQKFSSKLFCYSLILTFAPLALLFSVDNDCNLVFILTTLTALLSLVNPSISYQDNATQTEDMVIIEIKH